jgi:hypothetical protein
VSPPGANRGLMREDRRAFAHEIDPSDDEQATGPEAAWSNSGALSEIAASSHRRHQCARAPH